MVNRYGNVAKAENGAAAARRLKGVSHGRTL